jgi:hypothetical protein
MICIPTRMKRQTAGPRGANQRGHWGTHATAPKVLKGVVAEPSLF